MPFPRPYRQVDVFTATPYFGNPLAIVLDGTGLSDEEMQRFARWTNLSETTFVVPPSQPEADYRVRIFTPGAELPFAGHPTLGTCHAWLETGGQPKDKEFIVQECGVGLVRVRRSGRQFAFAAPPLQRSASDDATLTQVLRALGLPRERLLAAQVLNNGPQFLGLLIDDVDTLLALTPDHAALKVLNQKVGVAAPYPRDNAPALIARSSREARAFAEHAADAPLLAEPDLEVRAFVAPVGIHEDPVTGSLNASLAQWLIADGHMPKRYVAAQGTCLGRAGRVLLECDASGQVWVGGQVQTCISGQLAL